MTWELNLVFFKRTKTWSGFDFTIKRAHLISDVDKSKVLKYLEDWKQSIKVDYGQDVEITEEKIVGGDFDEYLKLKMKYYRILWKIETL